mmetsp:Transcript_46666/g.77775  ORF Transcript_46666/g.77775 Transcript_46666/m.77775 type:complete len:319 (+) Transcript_46666:238-1194(+)
MHRGHPLNRIHILGIIVGKEFRHEKAIFIVDDGTGIIPCVLWMSETDDPEAPQCASTAFEAQIGDLASFLGRPSRWKEQFQLVLQHFWIEKDPHAEILWWLNTMRLHKDVYSVPFQIPQGYSIEPERLPDDEVPASLDLAEEDRVVTEEMFVDAIKQHIDSSNRASFEYAELKGTAHLSKLAKDLAEQLYSTTGRGKVPLDTRVASVFRKGISRLVQGGFMFQRDSGQDLYEKVSFDLNIGPFILSYLQCTGPADPSQVEDRVFTSRRLGRSRQEVVEYVRKDLRFSRIPEKMINECLQHLEDSSSVYQEGKGMYRVV